MILHTRGGGEGGERWREGKGEEDEWREGGRAREGGSEGGREGGKEGGKKVHEEREVPYYASHIHILK